MRIPRIYHPTPLTIGTQMQLDATGSHHVLQVLRLRVGAELCLFDGSGGEFSARIIEVARGVVTAQVDGAVAVHTESPLALTLVQGVSRGERMDYTLQKAVELGVQHIAPVWMQRSQVRLDGERLQRRIEHWAGVIRGACEQSHRAVLPTLAAPKSLDDWLLQTAPAGHRVLLDAHASQTLHTLATPVTAITLLAGPEGGFDDGERELALACGFIGVRLGPRVLRTETAALAALAAIQTLWGDFRPA